MNQYRPCIVSTTTNRDTNRIVVKTNRYTPTIVPFCQCTHQIIGTFGCNMLVKFSHLRTVKGIVHPKMKILSFTHPQVVPNLYECLCSAEHKGGYSEECGKQSSSGAQLTSIVLFFPTMEVNGALKQPGYKLFKISSFVFGRTKKFIQVWNYLRVSKWQNFHFWVNYPFK